jgi:hypothetical protein
VHGPVGNVFDVNCSQKSSCVISLFIYYAYSAFSVMIINLVCFSV